MILIIVGLVLLGLFLIKFKEWQHRFVFLVIIVLGLLFVSSSYTIFKNHDVDLGSFRGILALFKLYVISIANMIKNLAKISTFAVKQNWGVNSSNISAVI